MRSRCRTSRATFRTASRSSRQVSRDLVVVLDVVGLRPAEQVIVGIAGRHFGIIADAEQEGSQRKSAGSVERCGGGGWDGERCHAPDYATACSGISWRKFTPALMRVPPLLIDQSSPYS